MTKDAQEHAVKAAVTFMPTPQSLRPVYAHVPKQPQELYSVRYRLSRRCPNPESPQPAVSPRSPTRCARGARRAGCSSSTSGCARRTRARPARTAWAASAAGWSTRRGSSPRSARSRSRRRPGTCRRRSRSRSSASTRSRSSSPGRRCSSKRRGGSRFRSRGREGDTHFRRIGWDEALDRVAADAARVRRREETFFYGSGRSSNEAAFLMQTLARAYGTANIHNCSFYCHQASGVALVADARDRHLDARRSTISTRPTSRSSRARTRRRTIRA